MSLLTFSVIVHSTKTCIVIFTPRLIKNAFNYYLIIYVIVHSLSTKKDKTSPEMVKT